ncbi:GNAT family N-acetyltransferase [Pontibacter sp. SGAir0037]|uniref:GNAT family N-acetyltransferase n=1 Tax=Pontibacter sp. SGAir0037 TaxID=2571030 RepID=UPI0010CD6B99|nr:GNAT family N-acetyltransferase [Pontibacter sp. SGAir0037]QCR24955.1 N-acetyltransferase [Pontibacter sp. SGAir0037]
MNVIHDDDDLRFYAKLGDEEAELTYTYPEDGVLDFDHTFIPEDYRGQGLANKLVKAGLDYVKENNLKFIPSCPAVEAYTRRHPEYNEYMS